MTEYNLHLYKTILKRRMVYRFSAWLVIQYVLMLFLGMIPMLCVALTIFDERFVHPTSTYVFSAILTLFTLANFLLTNAMVVITGNEIDINRENIIKVINYNYKKAGIKNSGQKVIRSFNLTYKVPGYVITAILDGDKIYLNKVTCIRGGGFSPFHGLYNYIICQLMAREFRLISK